MTRMVMCIIALAAASVGQQQPTPKPADESKSPTTNVVTIDPSEVTPVPRSGRKRAGPKSRSRASAAVDMRPAAICARDMNDALEKLDADKTYLAGMEQPEREDLYRHALDCLLLQQGTMALRRTAVVLEETRLYVGFFRGVDSGISRASELEQAAIDEVKNSDESEKQSVTHDYNALVDRYKSLGRDNDALVNRYNSLADNYNNLLSLAHEILASSSTRSSFPSFIPPPPPRELHLTCTASPLVGNMATVNCW